MRLKLANKYGLPISSLYSEELRDIISSEVVVLAYIVIHTDDDNDVMLDDSTQMLLEAGKAWADGSLEVHEFVGIVGSLVREYYESGNCRGYKIHKPEMISEKSSSYDV